MGCVVVCVCVTLRWCPGSEVEEEVEFQEFKRAYLKGMMEDEDEEGNVSGGDEMMPKEK